MTISYSAGRYFMGLAVMIKYYSTWSCKGNTAAEKIEMIKRC